MDEIWLTRLEFLFFHSESPFGHISELDWTLRCCSTALGWGFFCEWNFSSMLLAAVSWPLCVVLQQTKHRTNAQHTYFSSYQFELRLDRSSNVDCARYHAPQKCTFYVRFQLQTPSHSSEKQQQKMKKKLKMSCSKHSKIIIKFHAYRKKEVETE